VAATPVWSAARSGVLGDPGATAASAQIDQLLGTHAITTVYRGAALLAPNAGGSNGAQDPTGYWVNRLGSFDYDQPFTLTGTQIGRVEVPLLPVGNGADLLVSLCLDSSGSPGTAIVTTRIPADWITSLAAVAGAAGPDSTVVLTAPAGPLALPQYNTLMLGKGASAPWASPAASGMGAANNPSSTTSGAYFIQVGGFNSGSPAANVFTINWTGGATLAAGIPQPALPQAAAYAAIATTPDTLVAAGGQTGATAATLTANVYTAGWDPTSGTVSAWSSQAALPRALYDAFAAVWGETVYVAGGVTPSATFLSTVYWATVSNGQIQSWNTANPLPTAVAAPFIAAVNGYLIVAGGYINNSGSTTTSALYYAVINPDGSLGAWQAGPSMPTGVAQVGNDIVTTSSALTIIGGFTGSVYSSAIQSLAFGTTGPGVWQTIGSAATADSGIFQAGVGQWRVFSIVASNSTYDYADAYTTPRISVPLVATGLTSSATYHVRLQQVTGDLNDCLRTPLETSGAFPGNPTYLFRAKGASTWTAGTTGNAIPISVYDMSVGGPPWHVVDDSGARISTLAWTTTPNATLMGIAEATRMGLGLNANQGFETGVSPWVATNCTLTQSTTRSYAGIHSGQVVPNGTSSSGFITSELLPCLPGLPVTVSAWVWFTSAVTSNFSLSTSWYTAVGGLISTTSTPVSVAASTWTEVVRALTAPATAFGFTMVATLSGTPASSNIWFLDNVIAYDTDGGPQQSTVTQLEYSGTTLVGTTTLA
jgi:hypothetical protein